MIQEITSNSNPNIKHVKSLHKKKYREKYNEFIIEGLRIVEHGLECGGDITKIFLAQSIYESLKGTILFSKIKDNNIDSYILNDNLFKEICDTDNPQGILGIVKQKSYDINTILNKEQYFVVVLDRLQDPGNLGTIIRTADAAGVDCIITNKGCVDTYNNKTIRATMGSIFNIPIIDIESLDELIDRLIGAGTQIVSTVLEATKYYHEVKYKERAAIIIGNEANGISKELVKKSNIKVKIPMLGKAESLNASIASSIMIYEIVRQKLNSENLKI